jgi:hypothetical protein
VSGSFGAVKATSGMPCSGNDVAIGHGIAVVVAKACRQAAEAQRHAPQPSTAMSYIPNSRLVPRGLAAAWGDAADGPPTGCRAGRLPQPERANWADQGSFGIE